MSGNLLGSTLVIGGAGFLGTVLVESLLSQCQAVRIFDSFMYGQSRVFANAGVSKVEVIEGDVRNPKAVTDAINGVENVILLAALVGQKACDRVPKEAHAINYQASRRIVDECSRLGVRRLVFASTHSVYGVRQGLMYEDAPTRPISLYAQMKAQMEFAVINASNHGLETVVLRMGTLFGLSPRMRFDLVVNAMVRDALVRSEIYVHGGKQWRPLLHVRDAAHAYLMVLHEHARAVNGQVFNVGSGSQNMTISDVARLVNEQVPSAKVVTSAAAERDLRNYQVSHEKIARAIAYRTEHGVADGICEVRNAILNGQFGDCSDSLYYNA